MSPTQRHRWLTLPDSRAAKRSATLVGYVVDQARAEFDRRYPNLQFGPVVALIAAYNEEDNIGAVLKAMPTLVGDLEVTTLVVVDGAVTSRRFIPMLPAITPQRMSLETALKAFDKVMTESVDVHLRTDVPYGLFFSGGIDSSILLTLMQRLVGPRVQALTLGYSGQLPGDESWTALEIAKGSGAQCRRIEMTPQDFWRLAPRIAAALDDPTTDAAILPTFMLGQAARAEGLKVTLCGEGADELFGGYARYRRARLPWARFGLGQEERRGALDEAPGLANLFPGWSSGIAAIAADQRARDSMRGAEIKEGIRAFAEKRPPKF